MSTQNETEVQIIIETDNDGRYCSCEIVKDKDLAEKIVNMRRFSKQGYLHNYNAETHYLG
jgi:uncharacterized protein YuzE